MTLHDRKKSWRITIYQHVNSDGKITGNFGFYVKPPYIRGEGKGMKARILNNLIK